MMASMPAPEKLAAARSSVASRSTAFGYACRRCSRCCRHKQIQINPYKLARLARAKGRSTNEFRAALTVDGNGTVLRQKEDGSCVFLGPQGCRVHLDRPLVCRLYPLGRGVRPDGSEYFIQLEGHPQSEGELTDDGTIAGYLAAQRAQPFMDAADAYFEWLCAAHERLALMADQPAGQAGAEGADLLDMDSMIAGHCEATGEVEPANLEDRMRLHVRLLHDAIANPRDDHAEEQSPSAVGLSGDKSSTLQQRRK